MPGLHQVGIWRIWEAHRGESRARMTGSFPPWTLTLKGDERSSRPHFSSSNWAAIIREGFSYPFTPAVSLLHLFSIPLSLILGEVDERVWCFKSFSPHVYHDSPLFLRPAGNVSFSLFKMFVLRNFILWCICLKVNILHSLLIHSFRLLKNITY